MSSMYSVATGKVNIIQSHRLEMLQTAPAPLTVPFCFETARIVRIAISIALTSHHLILLVTILLVLQVSCRWWFGYRRRRQSILIRQFAFTNQNDDSDETANGNYRQTNWHQYLIVGKKWTFAHVRHWIRMIRVDQGWNWMSNWWMNCLCIHLDSDLLPCALEVVKLYTELVKPALL